MLVRPLFSLFHMMGLPAFLFILGACQSASSAVDGSDLLGVFDKRPKADGGHSVTEPGSEDRHDDELRPLAPVPPPDVSGGEVRLPGEAACLGGMGAPADVHGRYAKRPSCRDAQVLEWRDPDGAPRYACVFAPRAIEAMAPLPLLVFFHAPGEDPTSVDKKTSLRRLGTQLDMTGTGKPGFVILAVQGRNLEGSRWSHVFDVGYTGPGNVDLQATDHFVDVIKQRGWVNTQRVYAMGSGSGGQFAAIWAGMHADEVAAFAAYGSEAPLASWKCSTPPMPAFLIYRACDAVTECDAAERWVRAREVLGAKTESLRLGASDAQEPLCALKHRCTPIYGLANHYRWPKERDEAVVRFLGKYRLAVAPSNLPPSPRP